jgi:hypothetical protein
MNRITILLVLATLACGAAFGASRAETTTYVDGNLTGVSPNTGGTLLFSDEKAMYFRTGLITVPVSYANIGKAELGPTHVHSHDVPLYKVWALHKRFSGKTETQLLTVEFKNDEGEDRTMTLELAQPSAAGVLSQIQTRTTANGSTPVAEVAAAEPAAQAEPAAEPAKVKHAKASKHEAQAKTASAKPPADEDQWWGDHYWKTKRNADKWNTSAPDQK